MNLETLLISTDKQVLFDTIVTKLAEQGAQAYVAGAGCLYRVEASSCRCAIGHVLTDVGYDWLVERKMLEFDSDGISHMLVPEPDVYIRRFLYSMQRNHDDAQWRHQLAWGYRHIAKAERLDPKVCLEKMAPAWEGRDVRWQQHIPQVQYVDMDL